MALLLPLKKRVREGEQGSDCPTTAKCCDCDEYYTSAGQEGRCSVCYSDSIGKRVAKRPATHRLPRYLASVIEAFERAHGERSRRLVSILSHARAIRLDASAWLQILGDSELAMLERHARPLAQKLLHSSPADPDARLKSLLLCARVIDYWAMTDEQSYHSDVICHFNGNHIVPSSISDHAEALSQHAEFASSQVKSAVESMPVADLRQRIVAALALAGRSASYSSPPPQRRHRVSTAGPPSPLSLDSDE